MDNAAAYSVGHQATVWTPEEIYTKLGKLCIPSYRVNTFWSTRSGNKQEPYYWKTLGMADAVGSSARHQENALNSEKVSTAPEEPYTPYNHVRGTHQKSR